MAQLEALVSRVSIPVIAIGGIVPENVRAIRSTGAAGIAVMSGIWNADDPKSNAERYAGLLKRG